jgi:transmembrane sensor
MLFKFIGNARREKLPTPLEAPGERPDDAQSISGEHALTLAAARWMVCRQEPLSPAQESAFSAWLAADPAHADALQDLEAVWGRLQSLPEPSVARLRAGLPRPASRSVDWRSLLAVPPAAGLLRTLQAVGRWAQSAAWPVRCAPHVAVAIMTLLLLGGGTYAWLQQPVFQQTLVSARGMPQAFSLPDGSSLWLDTDSQAEVTFFRQRREVRLSSGQLFVAVKSEPSRPFEVLAGPLKVRAVGTRFSVRHTQRGPLDAGVNVVVEEGRVRVSRNADVGTEAAFPDAELVAGQSIQLSAAGREPALKIEAVSNFPAWREGRINFAGTPLAEAVAEFERYGDTRLVVRDPVVAAMPVHGSFDLRQHEAFARVVSHVLPVQIHHAGDVDEIIPVSRH